MRVNKSKCCYIILALLLLISCRSFKASNSISWAYKGEIKLKRENNVNLKFKLTIDSLERINIKLYTNTGFKIGNFKVYSDSISIDELYDESYRKIILDIYNKINNEIFFFNFIKKLVLEDIFDEKNGFERNVNCLKKDNQNDLKDFKIDVLSRECYILFTIVQKERFKHKKDKNFEIVIPKDIKIEIFIKAF